MNRTIEFKSSPKGEILVNHEPKHRSGHLGHALVEYEPGKLLAFYSNCSGVRNGGHTGFGWMEYKRSEDNGKTWSEPIILDYSMNTFLDGIVTISCEKAVVAADGTIVLPCVRNYCRPAWEPWDTLMVLLSRDGGQTWEEPFEFGPDKGRLYDMIVRENEILALEFCNDAEVDFSGNKPEHVYKLYVSTDCGRSFQCRSVIPFDALGRGYGALCAREDGSLVAYAYNTNDEWNLDYCVSLDGGRTWTAPEKSFCAKRIRNPQIGYLDGIYYLHGRSGCISTDYPFNFVLYTSTDAVNWDDGQFIHIPEGRQEGRTAYYSNNITVSPKAGEPAYLLIQSSVSYDGGRTNIFHWKIAGAR